MPSSGSGQNNYYASHHRRPSNQPYASVSDQTDASNGQIHSPTRSLVYLPTTTYSQQSPGHARQLSNSSGMRAYEDSNASFDPHEFYRGEQNQNQGIPSDAADNPHHLTQTMTLGQTRRRITSNPPFSPPTLAEASKSTPTLSGQLRSRKPSFKDLVAKFDASSMDDAPPVPSRPASRVTSRTVSPTITNITASFDGRGAQVSAPLQPPRSQTGLASRADHNSLGFPFGNSLSQPTGNLNISIPPRRPLFGEIVSGAAASTRPGYGIQKVRRRRGSEGSPMHSPNPMFPVETTPTSSGFSPISPTAWYTGRTPNATTLTTEQPAIMPFAHRRAQSDFNATQHSRAAVQDTMRTPTASTFGIRDSGEYTKSDPRRSSQSRIPISSRRYSVTSESGRSSPSSRGHSSLAKYPTSRSTTQNVPSNLPVLSSNRASPRQPPNSLTPVKSAGKRTHGVNISHSEKSPSLRANIIVPPIKISPPLRSSRPRVPISAAATSASRAKMAEKFTSMQKQNAEKRQNTRKSTRPPELNDVDLQARRLKITQALTRSRQGLDNSTASRPVSANVNASDTETIKPLSPATDIGGQSNSPSSVPEVVLDRTAIIDDADHNEFHTPTDEFGPGTHKAAQQLAGISTTRLQRDPFDVDSPTLGHPSNAIDTTLSLLQTRNHVYDRDSEPGSATTNDTGDSLATPIEVEPQAEFTTPRPLGRTVLSQIMRMRSPSSSSPQSFNSSPNEDAPGNYADDESVQIMLRNTQYFDDGTGLQHGETPEGLQGGSYKSPDQYNQRRSSWTSSIQDSSSDDGTPENETDNSHQPRDQYGLAIHPSSDNVFSYPEPAHAEDLQSTRSTLASDAYTIVNFVLQQSGIVDDELADHIYERVINHPAQLTEQGTFDAEKFEQFCQEELQDFERQRQFSLQESEGDASRQATTNNGTSTTSEQTVDTGNEMASLIGDDGLTRPHLLVNKPSYLNHRQKASLDSAEDFAETSPSIGSWMQFATHHVQSSLHLNQLVYSDQDDVLNAQAVAEDMTQPARGTSDDLAAQQTSQINQIHPNVASATPRPPSKSPPPPPLTRHPSSYAQAITPELSSKSPLKMRLSNSEPPQVPRRVTSLSQMATQSSFDPPMSMQSLTETEQASDGRPSLEDASLPTSSMRSSPTPEQRRLKQRRNVLKELIDTEARFEKDMKVLCDIYKETAYPTLSQEDIKTLFGNSDQVLEFATDFLSVLKRAAKPSYVMDRSERFQNSRSQGEHRRSQSVGASSSSTARDSISVQASDVSDAEKDSRTRIGEAFELSLIKMGAVYGDYLKNHDAANRKLQSVQQHALVREWLNECKKGSADLTNAWDLDSLMVKPVQRIMKYPLLLGQLIEATPAEHPDLPSLRDVLLKLTDINMRINDAKKHTELVDQVIKRRRKESDVRNGISKALGRRTEKLRQHVGISETFEDREYNALKHDYIENYGHLVLVSRDVQMYRTTLAAWVNRMCDLGTAADAWVDVGHTRHTEAESKLRQFGMLVRGISTIALPDHLAEVQKRVIEPMEKGWKYLETLANDPKGLLQKRDKRLIDYARFKNMKDRGEKLDKKTSERIEQWEALNVEAKDRMKKLLALTAKLVSASQQTLVELHLSWLEMCNRKFSAAMAISLDGILDVDIEKEWQVDFDYQHASALALSICNGSLLNEAVNMVSFLTTPASTFNGEDSPRPSWHSSNKRSISLSSDIMDYNKRHSGNFVASPFGVNAGETGSYGYANGRIRAASTTSGQASRTPDVSSRTAFASGYHTTTVTSGRPGTSPGRSAEPSPRLPRLSIDAPSPSFGPLRPDSAQGRPGSSSTFFSATGQPTQTGNTPNRGSGVFSSAMPMADSPVSSHPAPFEDLDRHYEVLFTAASVYEFNIDRSRREAGFPYLTYVAGEIFDVIGERGELWLARNQDDPQRQIGWIWNKHFAKLAE